MIIFAAGIASAIMLLSGCLLLIYMLLRKSHLQQQALRSSRVSSAVPALPRAKPTWQTSDSGLEMAEIARELNGQLTTKMIVLEQLLSDSQTQIERMEKLLERMEKVQKEQ